MDKRYIEDNYERWLNCAVSDPDLIDELKSMKANQDVKEDSFYRNLEFGTGGLRGIIGAGTNRVNVYTVAKASQGLANYVVHSFPEEERRVAISYDSRIKSDLFARISAEVFAGNGIRVFLFKELMPTPCLSFAVRNLDCACGIMVTASHNPSQYNGYKVYDHQGCQITTGLAQHILEEIEKNDIFNDIKKIDFDEGKNRGIIEFISDRVYTEFIEEVKRQSPLNKKEEVDKEIKIIYSPLNGTGLKPVLRILKESGYSNVTVVKEQEKPDGRFLTCPYPNPETEEAMKLGLEYAQREEADLLIATDPDCDRVGIAVKSKNGTYVLLSGNQNGVLLLDYICSMRRLSNTMPSDPVMIKTIVTTDMAKKIASHYGVRTIDVLTGFKFIGEQIGLLEKEGREESYLFGFEESYGYLSGSYVRDKDGVNAVFLTCEMFAYYKSKGIDLLEKLDQLYEQYGFYYETLHSYEFGGMKGFEKMREIMERFRSGIDQIGGIRVEKTMDYQKGLDDLPKSDVVKFVLKGGSSVVVRPSGTEPKLKLYLSIIGENKEKSKDTEQEIVSCLEGYLI